MVVRRWCWGRRRHFFKHQRGVRPGSRARAACGFLGRTGRKKPSSPALAMASLGRCLRHPTLPRAGPVRPGQSRGRFGQNALFFGQLKVHGVVSCLVVWLWVIGRQVFSGLGGLSLLSQRIRPYAALASCAWGTGGTGAGLRAGFRWLGSRACNTVRWRTRRNVLAAVAGVRGPTGAHHVFVQDLDGGVCRLKVLHRAGIDLNHHAVGLAGGASLGEGVHLHHARSTETMAHPHRCLKVCMPCFTTVQRRNRRGKGQCHRARSRHPRSRHWWRPPSHARDEGGAQRLRGCHFKADRGVHALAHGAVVKPACRHRLGLCVENITTCLP